MNKNKIALNFLPLNTSTFSFNVFTRKSSPNEKRWDENIRLLKLPDNDNKYINFWVSFEQFEDSEEITINSNINIELTKWYLFTLLKNRLKNENIEFKPSEKSFNPFRIYIITEEITEKGKKSVWIEPYYLKIKNEFGFLVDYKFIKNQNSVFDKYIQRLSLSLNDSYQSNKNFYIDKYRYIINFLKKDFSNFKELSQYLIIDTNFEKLTCKELKTKNYIFRNNNSNSQFNGLMQYEVFQPAPNTNQLTYIYLIKDDKKQYANDLIKALNGEFPTFKGVNKLGLPKQTNDNTRALIIEDYNNFKDKLEEISSNINFIIISIFPSKEEKFYYELKNYCLNKNIPLQTIHIETIADENKLKWSVSGIALQMFTKLGGVPWLVKTENNNCLIVGIAQSIERTGENISRFFAYSVLLEASGKFLKIEPLADEKTKNDFLNTVVNNVSRILDEKKNYQSIIFHVPEKIKKETVKKIEEILIKSRQNVELYILRINDDSRFFGYDENNNSLIPYESSYIQLSENEFLVWTEGLNYQNPRPLKRYGNPLYIQFFYSNQKNYNKELLLQDILNLSGANYRGFNAKALPVSLYYPKLISNFYKHFKEINLDQISVKTDKLWFI